MNSFDGIKSMHDIGTRLKQYIITDEIGRGGHGTVYRAYHEENIGQAVALKIIEDSGNLDSLLIEPELLSKLEHPHIIKLIDFFIYAGKLVLVTEYIEGDSLQSYLDKNGRFTESEVKSFLSQIGSALEHAHQNNIIHRDIKLSNILVSKSSQELRFTLVDFGISRISEGIQSIKSVAGTYYYMAPEQLRGRPCEQSDLWALGVCSYIMLTGVKPFEGSTEEELSKKIQFDIPKTLESTVDGIDRELEDILFQLLEKQLINRTESASYLVNELTQFSSVKPIDNSSRTKDKETFNLSTLEAQKNTQKRQGWIGFWIFTLLSTIPNGVIGEAISLGGLALLYSGQEKRNLSQTRTGIILIIVGAFISFLFWSIVYASIFALVGENEVAANSTYDIVYFISLIISFPAIIVATHFLTRIKRLKEDLTLYKALRQSSKDKSGIIYLLKQFVDINWGDINLRQKYIELLLLNNQVEHAIVEAKLLLEIDPYDFGAHLLLANGYLEIGLYEECIQVCNSYLAVSGHSFEFADLKAQCNQVISGV